MKIGFTLNGAPVCVEAPGTVSLLTLLAGLLPPDRHQTGLRHRRMRRLHGAAGRQGGDPPAWSVAGQASRRVVTIEA